MEEEDYEIDHEYVTNGSELNRIKQVIHALQLNRPLSKYERDGMAKDLSYVLDDFTDLTVSESWN